MSYIDYEIKLDETVRGLPQVIQALFSEHAPVPLIEEVGDTFELTMGEIGWVCELIRQVITKELQPENFQAMLTEKLDEDNQPKVGEIVAAINEQIFSKLLPALGIKMPANMATSGERVDGGAVEILEAGTSDENTGETQQGSALLGSEKYQGESLLDNSIGTNYQGESLIISRGSAAESAEPPNPPSKLDASKFNFVNTSVDPIPKSPVATRSTAPSFISPQPLSEFASAQNFPKISSVPSPLVASSYKPAASPTPLVEPSHEHMSDNPFESLMKMVMTGKFSEKDIERKFGKLPESLKTAIKSVDSAKKVVDIGRKYFLHVDKIGDLGFETGLVILGITHPGQFLDHLIRHLELPVEKVKAIAQEINAEIFLKIREALKEVNGEALSNENEYDDLEKAVWPTTTSQPPPYQGSTFVNGTAQLSSILEGNSASEEILDRDTILRDIENPVPVKFSEVPQPINSFSQPLIKTTPPVPPYQPKTTFKISVEQPKEKITRSTTISQPTTISPPASPMPPKTTFTISAPSAEILKIYNTASRLNPEPKIPIKITPPEIKEPPKKAELSLTTDFEVPKVSAVPTPTTVSTPQRSTITTQPTTTPWSATISQPTTTPPPMPKNVIDQKLSGTVASSRTENKYKMDPYREPLG